MLVPMLEDSEWELVEPLLKNAATEIKQYRQTHHVSLAEAREKGWGRAALEKYHELTGFNETNPDALWHHHISLYGPPCTTCGKPLRTPQAKFCAACGAARA